jgi:hypothetical protein
MNSIQAQMLRAHQGAAPRVAGLRDGRARFRAHRAQTGACST